MSPLMANMRNVSQLISGCLSGDRTAQEQLFHTYAGLMFTLCRRYTNNIQEAEDILQEGFIRVFKGLSSYESSGSFEGWLKRIFVNVALKHISKKSFTHEINGYEYFPDEPVEPTIISQLSEEQLLSIIAELPDGYRTVFNLYAIEGYSHKEIAELLDCQEATSRTQFLKARRLLQDRLVDLQKIAV